jgi:predicted RNA-binding protein
MNVIADDPNTFEVAEEGVQNTSIQDSLKEFFGRS